MEKLLLHTKNCISEVANYLLYVILLILIFSLFDSEKPHFFEFVIMVIVPLYYYLLRFKIHSFGLLILLHLAPACLIWIIYSTNVGFKMAFLVIACIQGAISLGVTHAAKEKKQWDGGNKTIMPVVVIVVGAVVYIASTNIIVIPLIIIFIVLYFLNLHLTQYVEYIEVHRLSTGNVPRKNIFFSGVMLVGFFILVAVLIMLLFATGFARWFIDVLHQFFTWFVALWSFEQAPLPEIPDIEYEQLEFNDFGESGDNRFFAVIGYIFSFLSAALIIFVVGSLIIWVFMLIIRGRTTKFVYRNDGVEEDDDIIEKLEWKREKNKNKRSFKLFMTADEKIRRIFSKVVNKHLTHKPILSSSTAREMLEFFGHSESAVLLVELYEKARYAHETCTEKDVKEAKRLAGEIGG